MRAWNSLKIALVLMLVCGPQGWAATNPASPASAREMEADKFSWSDLVPSFLDSSSEKAAPKAEDKKQDKQPSAADALPKDPPAPAPYKVYSSPALIEDRGQDAPVQTSVRRMGATVDAASANPANDQGIDPATAEIAALLKKQLNLEDGEPVRTPQPVIPNRSLSAANALATQFFPILPLGALPDTVASDLPLASNIPLTANHSMVVRAIVSIHDMSRNASDGLAMMTTLSGSDNGTTLILTPQFPIDIDVARFADRLADRGQTIARWPLGADTAGWEVGGDSVAGPRQKGISSFTALDLILLYLGNQQAFPSLKTIVVVGHGMGADFVQRYAAVGQAPDVLAEMHLPVRFLVANPSSYLYLTNQRPAETGTSFTIAKNDECPALNAYPYGMSALVPYARRMGVTTIQARYPSRHVHYLLGGRIIADPYLDLHCAAKAQGKDRLTRGKNFERYLSVTFGGSVEATQSFSVVPNAGYDPVSLYGSYCGLSVLFGDGKCTAKR